jgi:hypothetical protein
MTKKHRKPTTPTVSSAESRSHAKARTALTTSIARLEGMLVSEPSAPKRKELMAALHEHRWTLRLLGEPTSTKPVAAKAKTPADLEEKGMVSCDECEAENDADAKHCDQCGHELDDDEEDDDAEEEEEEEEATAKAQATAALHISAFRGTLSKLSPEQLPRVPGSLASKAPTPSAKALRAETRKHQHMAGLYKPGAKYEHPPLIITTSDAGAPWARK